MSQHIKNREAHLRQLQWKAAHYLSAGVVPDKVIEEIASCQEEIAEARKPKTVLNVLRIAVPRTPEGEARCWLLANLIGPNAAEARAILARLDGRTKGVPLKAASWLLDVSHEQSHGGAHAKQVITMLRRAA